jgi:hypothetical protein
MTSRAYLRLSPRTFHDKAVVDRYPPGAFAAFSAVLCLAEEQPERGRFRSEKLLRLHLDEPMDGVRIGWGKWVGYLLEHGDLERRPDGSLYVTGWDDWQEGDVTVAERMSRLRARKANGAERNHEAPTVTVPVTPTVTVPAVTVPYSGGGSGNGGYGGGDTAREPDRHGLPHITSESQTVAEDITGRPILTAGEKQLTEWDRLVEDHGEAKVCEAFRRVAGGKRLTYRQLVWDAVKSLEPFAKPTDIEDARKAGESEDNWERRVDATKKRNADMRRAMGYDA